MLSRDTSKSETNHPKQKLINEWDIPLYPTHDPTLHSTLSHSIPVKRELWGETNSGDVIERVAGVGGPIAV